MVKRYTYNDFMSDFVQGMAANGVPRKNYTTTYLRAEKRRQQALDADWSDFGSHGSEGPDEREKLFNKIVEKVKKEHPEMKNIKARRYARTQSSLGRKFQRLKDQGYGIEEIAKRIGYNSKTGKFKASSGHSGG